MGWDNLFWFLGGIFAEVVRRVIFESEKNSRPTICSECGDDIYWYGIDWYCTNPNCPKYKGDEVA